MERKPYRQNPREGNPNWPFDSVIHVPDPQAADQIVRDLITGRTGLPRQPGGAPNAERLDPRKPLALGEFALPDQDVFTLVRTALTGGRRERQTAEAALITHAVNGTSNDALDAINATLASLRAIRLPQESRDFPDLDIPKNTQAYGVCKQLVANLFRALGNVGKTIEILADRPSTGQKSALAAQLADDIWLYIPDNEKTILPSSFIGFREKLIAFRNSPPLKSAAHALSFHIPPDLSSTELARLRDTMQRDPYSLSQEEFDLAIKAWSNGNQTAHTYSQRILEKLLTEPDNSAMLFVLKRLNGSLTSNDQAVRNLALARMSELYFSYAPLLRWFHTLQGHFREMLEEDSRVDEDIATELATMIQTIGQYNKILPFSTLLTLDYTPFLTQEGNQSLPIVAPNQELLEKLLATHTTQPAIELIARAARVREREARTIDQETFLELFDERRPLGYFLDNLKVGWQPLQRITRERMWLSFIRGRQAKIWPSEKELNILQFIDKDPAAVLGFEGIRFLTRGYIPPEVGLEFTFKNSDRVLGGTLDANGHLVDLPFDLDVIRPDIHAYIEWVAVASFQELITIASERIQPKGQGSRRVRSQRTEVPGDHEAKPPLLPRHQVTYVTFDTERQPEAITTDRLVEEAHQRERLVRYYPPTIVPLANAKKYQLARERASTARAQGADPETIRKLEGEAIRYLQRIPKPSGNKLDTFHAHFPREFSLPQLPDGKYVKTWRRQHQRPKLEKGEEEDVEKMYEKRFRAAPIAMTPYIASWFTRPPLL